MAMSAEKDEPSRASLEEGITSTVHLARGNDRYHFNQSDLDQVQRRLKQRHVQMFVPLVGLCVQSPSP
jgi:amino acid permease